MRLGINTLFWIPGEVGGSETYLLETLTALLPRHAGIEPVFFTNRENNPALRTRFGTVPGTAFVALPVRAASRPARILCEQILLPLRARAARLDVLWSPGYTAPLAYGGAQAVSLLDMQYRRFPEDMGRLARWTTHALVCAAARRCARVLTLSAFSRVEVLRFTAVRPERVVETPLAADPAFAAPLDAAERRRRVAGLLPPGETPYFLCVANTYPHKNVALLVGAFARAAERLPHGLVLVGKPRRGEPAVRRALSDAPGIASRVVRLEGVSREVLTALYQGASAFVFPSLYEGFGLPVLEAMAAGTPVIATREAALAEVGGDATLAVSGRDASEMAAALQRVAAFAPAERDTWIERGRAQARRFSWAHTADTTYAALRDIVRERMPRR